LTEKQTNKLIPKAADNN